MRRRWSDFRTACPARPKNATPSWISGALGLCFSRNTSASGCPEPSTGTAPSGAVRAISSPSSLISEIAFCRYFSEISSVGTADTAGSTCSPSADPFLGLGRPLERLEVEQRTGTPNDLRAAQADQELLRPVECAHANRARP